MRTVENFIKEFDATKLELKFLIEKLELKFTVEEILNFDSITYKDITIDFNIDEKKLAKQDYLILANESYDIIEETDFSSKRTTKKTRTTLFSLKKSKLIKLDDEIIFNSLLDYTKLISLYDKYKLLRKELDTTIDLEFPEIATWFKLAPVYGIQFAEEKINSLRNKRYNEYFELQSNLLEEEKLIYQERSSKLSNKLQK